MNRSSAMSLESIRYCRAGGLTLTPEEVLQIAFRVYSCVDSWTSTYQFHHIRQVTLWISGWKRTYVYHPHEISESDQMESWNEENSLSDLHRKICTHLLENVSVDMFLSN